MLRSQVLQHVDLSDTGLTEGILLRLSKTIKVSISLLSIHLSGNPGLKDGITRKIQGKLKATYEAPLLKKTFKPLIRMYDMKYGGGVSKPDKQELRKPMRNKILDDIEEGKSISSMSLHARYSGRDRIEPAKVKEQLGIKALIREKEALTSFDDAKISRDHKRHFMVSRSIGHDLDIPGSSNWQISRDSQQECWVCDRKQYTFFIWSPEFGEFEQNKELLSSHE
jgi:hypothetical protein